MKIAVMPFVCFIEFFYLKTKISLELGLSIIVIMVGIGFCTVDNFGVVSHRSLPACIRSISFFCAKNFIGYVSSPNI
jgi:hypothetical protein